MYLLLFDKNKSNNFGEALAYAEQLGGSFDGKTVRIKVEDHDLLGAYQSLRTLFGIIQRWKSTRAIYNGKTVHPYRFILKREWIRRCYQKGKCGNQWNCKQLFILNHKKHLIGHSWFNIGHFRGDTWLIDKKEKRGYYWSKLVAKEPIYVLFLMR